MSHDSDPPLTAAVSPRNPLRPSFTSAVSKAKYITPQRDSFRGAHKKGVAALQQPRQDVKSNPVADAATQARLRRANSRPTAPRPIRPIDAGSGVASDVCVNSKLVIAPLNAAPLSAEISTPPMVGAVVYV